MRKIGSRPRTVADLLAALASSGLSVAARSCSSPGRRGEHLECRISRGSSDPSRGSTWAITDLMDYGLRREYVDLANTVVPYTDHITDPTVVAWS